MDFEKKKSISKNAYAPYFKESVYCLIIFIFVAVILLVLFACVSLALQTNALPFFTFVLLTYFIADCFLNHRLALLALWEMRGLPWESKEIIIQKISKDWSWLGRFGESIISKIYSKQLYAERYKLICKTKDGNRLVVRCVMSGKKYQILQDRIFNALDTKCVLSYAKYTHIVMYYNSQEEWAEKLNHMF